MNQHEIPNALDTARDLLRTNRPREAAALASAFLQEHPHDEQAWHILSFAICDPEKQAYALERVLQINPGNRAARLQLSRLLAPVPAPTPQLEPVEGRVPQGRSTEREPTVTLGRETQIQDSSGGSGNPPGAARSATPVLASSLAVEPFARPTPVAPPAEPRATRSPSTFARVSQYVVVKGAMLFLTVAVGLYLATTLINYGGFVDQIFEADIEGALQGIARGLSDVPPEDIPAILEEARQSMREASGLNEPFLVRNFRWFLHGLTLQWGDAERTTIAGSPNNSVRDIILERLPRSLLLLAAGNLVVFVGSLFLALALSKRYGSLADRVVIGLSPLSAAPTWVHGILLTVIFAAGLRLLPFGGMYDEAPPTEPIGYVWVLAKHMILPVAAIFMASFFQSVYAWRTFFVLHSGEDYVEMAEAKGLPPRMVERRYILQPALPFIITSFALMLITSWQGLLVLEVFFHWPGIGQLFIESVRRLDRPVLVALIVIFAYLLALTSFLLDLVYALVDPRVRIGGRRTASKPRQKRRIGRRHRRRTGTPRKVQREKTGALIHPAHPPRSRWEDWKSTRREFGHSLGRLARGLMSVMGDLVRYPSAVVGLLLILGLLGMAVYAVVALPLEEAISLARGAREDWYVSPGFAQPAWVNFFRKDDLPPSIVMDSAGEPVTRTVEAVSEDMTRISLSFPFDYPYGEVPQDILVFIRTNTREKRPFVVFTWTTPDGREIEVANFAMEGSDQTYYLSADTRFARKVGGQEPMDALFFPSGEAADRPLRGRYEFGIEGLVFEEDAEFDARVVIEGRVYGLAGTDHMGRDLTVPLLWGTPIALVFGLVGAVGTAILSLVIAAVGAWFGGWVDDLVQRLTEITMILPTLPIAIMVYLAYSKSVWVILAVMVLLNIFGSAIKNYRAIILQVKESPYVEAAQVYGASNRRIILRYLVPKILPVLVPTLVTLIPGYVFLEATLAYLGVMDPILPTWGKVINEALRNGAFQGHYYWVLEPIVLLLLTGLAFALLGFALDRLLNPKLRSM